MIMFTICDTRVGSTAFGNGLSSDTVHFQGEILYPQKEGDHISLYAEILKSETILYENENDAFEFLDEFFMPFLKDKDLHIFDIKYHDFYSISTVLHRPLSCPLFLNYIIKKMFPVVHLNRRNKMKAALSSIVAVKANRHHIFDDADRIAEKLRLEVNVFDLISETQERQKSHELFRQWLSRAERIIELEYEAIFENENGVALLIEAMEEELDVGKIEFKAKTVKMGSIFNVEIINREEILKVCNGTSLELEALESV